MSATSTESRREAELQILRERARKLAQVPATEAERDAMQEIVRFRLGENMYAIEAHYVFATRWLHELTPVPGAPPAFLGITPHHGGVLPVVALDVLFGHASLGLRDLHRVLVIGDGTGELGLAAGKDIEMAWLAEGELLPAVDVGDSGSGSIVAGMTEDGLTLLDGAAFLADPRLIHGSPRTREASAAASDEGE